MAFISKNPATEEVVAEFEEISDKELEQKLTRADEVYKKWSKVSFRERSQLMKKLASVLKEKSDEWGHIIAEEMGKPIADAKAEVEKCAWVCEYYAEKTEEFLAPEHIKTDSSESFVRFDPIGPVLAVMPWNFPFWQVFRFAAPALMAGNTGLLKHASNVPGSALAIEAAFDGAGFPKGTFQTLLIGSSRVEGVVRDSRVRAVTLTGSEKAGGSVAKIAGEVLKKTVLELGGSDPFIVLKDAALSSACEAGVTARLQNTGQSCIAAKRFILVKDIADEFVEMYKARYEKLVVGDPMDEKTDIGPLATEGILKGVMKQVEESVKQGATVVTGGKRLPRKGYFYAPTILDDVAPGMPAYEEEIFGPVASVIVVKDENEAVNVANDTSFGLGASVWTKDVTRAKEEFVPRIEAGAVFVNEMVKSDPRLPFGGIKRSGYGRELSHYGIKEFVNIKTVKIK